jgi:VCBS repeat-containing protein
MGRTTLATPILTGFPDATTTGVSAGTVLTSHAGDLVIDTPGAVISGLNITGTVYINAPNVTIENCKITSDNWWVVIVEPGVTGALVQNCDINGTGTGPQGQVGIAGQGTFLHNNIYNVENGVDVRGDNTLIQDNYIHDLQASGDPHYDGIQISASVSNVTVRHNTDISPDSATSAVYVANDWGSVSNIVIDNNELAGGGFTVYSDQKTAARGGTGTVTGVQFTNNKLESGHYGFDAITDNNVVWQGNTDLTGRTVTVDGALGAAGSTGGSTTGGSTGSTPPAAPTITAFSTDTGVVGDHITKDNTLTLTGTAVANSTVKVFVDGVAQSGTATADAKGSWSYITNVLTDAIHTLKATDTVSGVTSAASSPLSVTVDTAAPAAPALISDSVVNTNHVLLSGTAEANSSITVYDGATAVGATTTGTDGNWSVTTAALPSGAQALTAKATDAAGNTSALSAALDPVIGGATAPAAVPKIVSLTTDSGIAGDGITNDNTPTLAGTAVANSTVNLFDGLTKVGTGHADGSGAWTVTTSTLSEGAHNLTAIDTDTSGHTSAASTAFGVTIDTHAPGAPTMAAYSPAGTAVGSNTTVADLILKGTAEANSTVDIFDGGKQIGVATASNTGAWQFDTGHLADGSHSFMSKAVDVAGNPGAASAVDSVTINSPVNSPGSAVGITNMYENSSHIATIKGTADAYSHVKLYDGIKSLGTVTTAADGTWSFVTSSALSNTVHKFTAQEVDSSGHVVASSGSAILGSSHSNTLTSTKGDDYFVGNGHPDTFVFAANFGNDVIKDFVAGGRGHDVVQFSKSVYDSFASVLAHAAQVGQDVVISAGTNDSLTLKNTKLSALNTHDFHFA